MSGNPVHPAPWSPRQRDTERIPLALFLASLFGMSVWIGYTPWGATGGWVALSAHVVLTGGFTVYFFRIYYRFLRSRWSPSTHFPLVADGLAVVEGYISAAYEPLLAPRGGGPCVAWGIVESGPKHPDTEWRACPFFLDDAYGRGRILVDPNSPGSSAGFGLKVPDLVGATYLGGSACPLDTCEELTLALDRAERGLGRGGLGRGGLGRGAPASSSTPKPVILRPSPLYELVIREGDVVTIRGRFVATEQGPPYRGEAQKFKLYLGELERGTAREVISRRGYHWHIGLESCLLLASMAATGLVGLVAVLLP